MLLIHLQDFLPALQQRDFITILHPSLHTHLEWPTLCNLLDRVVGCIKLTSYITICRLLSRIRVSISCPDCELPLCLAGLLRPKVNTILLGIRYPIVLVLPIVGHTSILGINTVNAEVLVNMMSWFVLTTSWAMHHKLRHLLAAWAHKLLVSHHKSPP